MNLSISYLAAVFNSTLRYMTPILLVSLCAGVCSKSRVFNIGLEGTLLTSAFFAFLVQYKFRNIYLSVAAAVLVAMLITFIIAFFIVKLNGHSMIVGMAVNTFAMGFTTFLLQMVFKTKGVVSDPTLQGLPKVDWPDDFDTKAIGPDLGYVRRNLDHGISAIDWYWMLEFAKKHFGK